MRYIVLTIAFGCGGGPEVVSPATPHASVGCEECLYAVGSTLVVSSTWEGVCKPGGWHIGVEGGVGTEVCDRQNYKTHASCKAPGCVVENERIILREPGTHSIHVAFQRVGGSDESTDLVAHAALADDYVIACERAKDPAKTFVGVSLWSKTHQHLQGPIAKVTAQGAACEHDTYGSTADRYACPLTESSTVEIEVSSPALTKKRTVQCHDVETPSAEIEK